jgi:hypothetical protein
VQTLLLAQPVLDDLKKKIEINFTDISFEDALDMIFKKTGIEFNYNKSRIPVTKKVSIQSDTNSILNVITNLTLQTNTELKIINGNKILIVPKDNKKANREISGKLKDAKTERPLIGANILITGTTLGTVSNDKGEFLFENLPSGSYSITFNYIGYEPQTINGINLIENKSEVIEVGLNESSILVKEVIVTPGAFSIMGKAPYSKQTLTQEEFKNITLAEDAYRAIRRLPGISSNDYSAHFGIRGGKNNEILVQLDGLQLYEPFHLKDFMGGFLSIIDVEAISGIDLLTGGFTSEYGDKLSGVFNINTINSYPDNNKLSMGLSLMNARLMSNGTFADKKGYYFFSARRGYLDLVLSITNDEDDDYPTPEYYDLLGKVEYKFSTNHTMSFNYLFAMDDLELTEDDKDYSETSYGNYYFWLTNKYFLTKKIFLRNIFSYGRVSQDRKGIGYIFDDYRIHFNVRDEKYFNIFRIKQDWDFELSDKHVIKWGFDLANGNANYDYFAFNNNWYFDNNGNRRTNPDTLNVEIAPSGNQVGAYVSSRLNIIKPLTVEVGLRYDYASYIKENLLSPRINLAYSLGGNTFIRGAWGYYRQFQALNDLEVKWNRREFEKAQLAEHYLLGFEHYFNKDFHIRVEGYYKEIRDRTVEYRSYEVPDNIEVYPEFAYEFAEVYLDKSISKGIEVYLKYKLGDKFSLWASYSYSVAIDKIRSMNYQNRNIPIGKFYPNLNDQTHTAYFDFNYKPNRYWNLNLGIQYHTGWPYNEPEYRNLYQTDEELFESVCSKYNSFRFPDYLRLDLRVNRYFQTNVGKLTVFLELINFLSRDNVRAYKFRDIYTDGNGNVKFTKKGVNWMPLLPSIGISWEIDY